MCNGNTVTAVLLTIVLMRCEDFLLYTYYLISFPRHSHRDLCIFFAVVLLSDKISEPLLLYLFFHPLETGHSVCIGNLKLQLKMFQVN